MVRPRPDILMGIPDVARQATHNQESAVIVIRPARITVRWRARTGFNLGGANVLFEPGSLGQALTPDRDRSNQR